MESNWFWMKDSREGGTTTCFGQKKCTKSLWDTISIGKNNAVWYEFVTNNKYNNNSGNINKHIIS